MSVLGAPVRSTPTSGQVPAACDSRGGDRMSVECLIEQLRTMGPGWLRAMGRPCWLDEGDVINDAVVRLLKLDRSDGGLPSIRKPNEFLKGVLRHAFQEAMRQELGQRERTEPGDEERKELPDAEARDAFDRKLQEIDGRRACEVAQEALHGAPGCPEHEAMRGDDHCDQVVRLAALRIVDTWAGPGTNVQTGCSHTMVVDALAEADHGRYGHHNRGAKARSTVLLCLLWNLQVAAQRAHLPGLLALAHHRLLLELPKRIEHHVGEHRRRADGPSWKRIEALLTWLETEAEVQGVVVPLRYVSGPEVDAVHCPRQWTASNLQMAIDQLDASLAELRRLASRPCSHDNKYHEEVASLIEGADRCRTLLVRRLEALEP